MTRIEEAGGVLTIGMKELKDLYGAGRLGTQVRANITLALKYHRLSFLGELPNDERDQVRLYIRGTRVGRIIEAVGTSDPRGDRELRAVADSNDKTEMKSMITQLRRVLLEFASESAVEKIALDAVVQQDHTSNDPESD